MFAGSRSHEEGEPTAGRRWRGWRARQPRHAAHGAAGRARDGRLALQAGWQREELEEAVGRSLQLCMSVFLACC